MANNITDNALLDTFLIACNASIKYCVDEKDKCLVILDGMNLDKDSVLNKLGDGGFSPRDIPANILDALEKDPNSPWGRMEQVIKSVAKGTNSNVKNVPTDFRNLIVNFRGLKTPSRGNMLYINRGTMILRLAIKYNE